MKDVRERMIWPEKKKPEVDLKKTKGIFETMAVFNVMAITAKALNEEKMYKEKNEYINRMFSCNSYIVALEITAEYVKIV